MDKLSTDHANNCKKICRTCLMESSQMFSIFENNFHEIIMACVSVNVSFSDQLPNSLCISCYGKFRAFYKFKQLCIESNAILHKIKQGTVSNFPESLNTNVQENEYNFVNKIEGFHKKKSNMLKEHVYINYKDNTYKCRIKTDGISYFCSICSAILYSKQILHKHVVSHLKTKFYFCNECGKGYKDEHGLIKHSQQQHTTKTIQNKIIKCSICEQSFKRRLCLNRHIRTHIVKKSDSINTWQNQLENIGPPYNCTRCGKAFRCKLNLKQHIRRHNGEKFYVCDICGKAFVTSSELKAHVRKHKGIKSKHICEICGKDFAASTALQIHTRKHTGERPFSCEQCGRSYKEMGTLRKHNQIVHKKHGKNQFICDICGRETISPSALVIHIRTHTGEKPFLCAECGREFISQGRLNKHKKTHKDIFL